jgi:flagellar hook protein FlgE
MLGNGTLTFDSTGKLLSTTGTTLSINRTGTGAQTPLAVTLDFSQLTGLTSQQSQMVMTKQDGSPIGTLNNFSVGADGKVVGEFSNGLTKTLGQIAMATFNNPEGLVDQGGNLYQTGAASGLPVISAPQQLGSGSIRSGALEQSNVDLSKEFTNLIIASTGFTASSRVISTSNQLLTELLNTAR